jgi:hypothetical protein
MTLGAWRAFNGGGRFVEGDLPVLERVRRWLSHRYLPVFLAVLATVLALPALWMGLQFDDHRHWLILQDRDYSVNVEHSPFAMFHFADGSPEHAQHLMDCGFFPWWTLPTVRLMFCRPVTVLTHMLDHRLWPDTPALMHVHSLVWAALLVVVSALLYRKMMGAGWVAGLAALLYAIDDGHSMPVAWVANRNGVLAAVFGLLAVLHHVRWRRDGNRLSACLAPAFLLLGVLSNEGAIGACAYLFAYAVVLDQGTWRVRLAALAPCAITVVGWRLVYNALGYGVWGSATYIDPVASPLRFLGVVGTRAPVLLLGQWALPPSEVFILGSGAVQRAILIVAVFFVAILAAILIPLLRRDAMARFWTLGMVVALVPATATFPADRLMLFGGVGGMGLLACFLRAVWHGDVWGTGRRLAVGLSYLFVVVHLVLAPILFPIRAVALSALGSLVTDCLAATPLPDDVEEKTVIFTNAPNIFYTSDLINVRAVMGEPIPARVRSLAPNTIFPVAVRLTRMDERTIEAEPVGGYPWLLVRDGGHPFAVGDVVDVAGMSVTVLSLADEGWPLKVRFRFDKALEDPSYVWLRFERDTYVPFTSPGVGETVVLGE